MSYSDSLSNVFQHPFMEKLGWALLHFIWQGIAIAFVFWLALVIMRRASANARYLAACAGLFLMAILPAITLAMLPNQNVASTAVTKKWSDLVRPDNSLRNSANATGEELLIDYGSTLGNATAFSEDVMDAAPVIDVSPAVADADAPAFSLGKRCETFVRPWLSSMIVGWMIGVFSLAVRLLLTWTQVQRIQTHGVSAAGAEQTHLMERVSTRLGVRQVVRLLESSLVEVPTVIGWLKPVILLPIASMNALTVSQLEAILAHELAHIQRADYIVNLLQSLIETLLFYHPAVWWMSARIRQEREHCCDDLAASISGDAAGYVAALVRMEELRCEPQRVAIAARGGHLLGRVRRLLVPSAPDRLSPWWLTGAAALVIVGGLIGLPVLSKIQAEAVAVQEPDQKPQTDEAKSDTLKKDEDADAGPLADLDNITPSQIADRIEAAWKRYESIEFTAAIEETRNTNAFATEAKPILVKGTGSLLFRTDGARWFAAVKTSLTRAGSNETNSTDTQYAFDGSTHQTFDGRNLILGQDAYFPNVLVAPQFFWQAGISTDLLIGALRRPEAKLVEHIKMAETSCLHVEVKWKPDWDTVDRHFDIMICPEQGWLTRRVVIERGGELQAEWSINEIATTESGLAYPVEFKTKRPETDSTPLRRVIITSFRDRPNFKPEQFVIPPQLGMDIVDHRHGFAWHNDPWWDELSPWLRENLDWPQPNLKPLKELQSYSEPELAGKDAPEIVAGEWLTDAAPLHWNRAERKVTVLHFFGGLQIQPSPEQLKALDFLQRRYRDGGLEVIAIASDGKYRGQFRQTVEELNLSYPVMIDNKASDADIASKKIGAEWGATFVAYRLRPYTGTVVINGAGRIQFVDPNTPNLPTGMSHVESLVRDALVKANGTADPPALRQSLLNRSSRILRGTPLMPNELSQSMLDRSPLWLQNAQQTIVATLPQAQRDMFKSNGITIQSVLNELNGSDTRIPHAAFIQLEREWQRRAAVAKGRGLIHGSIRSINRGAQESCSATILVEPILRVLSSNTPGGWTLSIDQSRSQKNESLASGAFAINALPKGTYRMTVAAPGKARAVRVVQLADHESEAKLEIVLWGSDSISGKVTDAAGDVIAKATVKAVKRFEDGQSQALDRYTTEYLPQQPVSTNASGDFAFESLFEGLYVFEVSAEGYETTTTEPQPSGATDLRVILKPKAQPDQANVPAAKSIFGRVTHQGQPVANAKVGLQAWIGPSGGYRDVEPFVATAVTGVDGQYMLRIPATVDDKSSIAIWAVADGYQPTRENIVLSLTDATAAIQAIPLTKCPGSIIQINNPDGQPLVNAKVIVPNQTLPQSIDFEIPHNWRDLVTGTTDAEGRVTLPHVVADAITGVRIIVPGQDGEIRVTGNYFLNRKPAETAPHYVWTLPGTGTLEGQINAPPGTLPNTLMLQVSTAAAMPGDRQHFEWIQGVARPAVDANGRFRIGALTAGTVSIKPFLPADSPLRAEVPQNLVVATGETTKVTIPVTEGTHVRGRIIASDTRNGLEGVTFSILYGASAREQKNMDERIDITTDKEGRFDAWVPPGKILLRISWRDEEYSDAEWWSKRIDGLGSAFEIPPVEEFELDPIEFVPTGHVKGKVVDQNGKALTSWTITGYPQVEGRTLDTIVICVVGTSLDEDGEFRGRFPSTFPPVFWQVRREQLNDNYHSRNEKLNAEVVSSDPLILRVDTKTLAPQTPLKTAANSGDPGDDELVKASGLAGIWSLQSMTWNGISVPEEQCRQTTMTIDGHQLSIDKYWNIYFSSVDPVNFKAEGGFSDTTGFECAIRVRPNQSPKSIDLTLNGVGTPGQESELNDEERILIQSGKLMYRGIYDINGDELKLCWDDNAGDASSVTPEDFTAGESSGRTLCIFRRKTQ